MLSYTAPIGSIEERDMGIVWPGRWVDVTPYLTRYALGFHTGADLNLNYPHWDSDRHSAVYTIGKGTVTYAQLFSRRYWGNIIIIDHGIVDGSRLVSRYGHVENIRVAAGQVVETGEQIADVGNGEGLFAYHLHFDISCTDQLLNIPGHWPGTNIQLVRTHYVDPRKWLQAQISGVLPDVGPSTTQTWYVVASLGLRVRQDHSRAATQVGSLSFGAEVTLKDGRVDEDFYIWGQISGGLYDGDWMAVGPSGQNETFVSHNPPVV